MEAAEMQLLGRRKERAGEVDTLEINELEEEDEEEEDEEEDDKDKVEIRNLDSSDEEYEPDEEKQRELRAQVMRLELELEKVREVALRHEGDSLELQGLLEDERFAAAQQAETFTKEIQRLQAQMSSLKQEFDSLQEGKDVELDRLESELQEANEEIHSLRLDAEEAAALHENEVAGLQEEICRLKAELERVQRVRNEYDMEVTALRAEINMKRPGTGDSQPAPEMVVMSHFDDRLSCTSEEVTKLQEDLRTLRIQYQQLMNEYQILQESNNIMVNQLATLEALKYRATDCHAASAGQKTRTSLTSQSGQGERKSRRRAWQQEQGGKVEHDQTQDILREMESKCWLSQNEREQLHEELRMCKEEIERLNGNIPIGGRVPAGGRKPLALFAILAVGFLLYPCVKRYSSSWRMP
nr:coiled-coil domain-containing protein 136 [Zootoca vivipara]